MGRPIMMVMPFIRETIRQKPNGGGSNDRSPGINNFMRPAVGIVNCGAAHSSAGEQSGENQTRKGGIHKLKDGTPNESIQRIFNFSKK